MSAGEAAGRAARKPNTANARKTGRLCPGEGKGWWLLLRSLQSSFLQGEGLLLVNYSSEFCLFALNPCSCDVQGGLTPLQNKTGYPGVCQAAFNKPHSAPEAGQSFAAAFIGVGDFYLKRKKERAALSTPRSTGSGEVTLSCICGHSSI